MKRPDDPEGSGLSQVPAQEAEIHPSHPRTGGGWRDRLAPWYGAYALLGVVTSASAIWLPLVVEKRAGTAEQVGAVMSAVGFGVTLSPLWGFVADLSGAYKTVFRGGFVALGGGLWGILFGHTLLPLVLFGFVQGVGIAASNTLANALVVECYDRSQWDQRIGWLQTFNAAGQVVGLLLPGIVSEERGIKLVAGLCLLALPLAGLGVCPPRRAKGQRGPALEDASRNVPQRTAERWRHYGLTTGGLFQHGYFRLGNLWNRFIAEMSGGFAWLIAQWFLFTLVTTPFFAFFPLLMRNVFGVAPGLASTSYAVAVAAMLPLYSLAGERMHRRGPGVTLREGLFARACSFGALGVIAYWMGGNRVALALTMFVVVQLAWPFISVSMIDFAVRLAKLGEASAMGLFNGSAAVAGTLGSLAGGFVAARAGYRSLVVLGCLGTVLCWGLAALTLPSEGRSERR